MRILLASLFLAGLGVLIVAVLKWRSLHAAQAGAPAAPKDVGDRELRRCIDGGHWHDCLDAADALLRRHRFSDAIIAFDRALLLTPWNEETEYPGLKALVGKAACLVALNRREEAHRCLNEVIVEAQGKPAAEKLILQAEELRRLEPVITTVEDWHVISPLATSAEQVSPNGKLTAAMRNGKEIGWGDPVSGTLEISSGVMVPDCSPSFVWSDDSRYLAVPQWTESMRQRILIIRISDGSIHAASGEYNMLRLESFQNGIITGVDSPAHAQHPVEVAVTGILSGRG
jgi:tetratricopeptide (TPR) repeat protein